jgi:tetratricopeptide (TPR) repeat protein
MTRARRWLPNLWLLLLLMAGGVLVALAFPYLASARHLEAGGRAINTPSLALEHLHKAIEWDSHNAQAYRLLGKVYRAQGDWPAAVEALTRHTELRPNNPLGHIELAELYEEIEAEMGTMHRTNLISLLPEAKVETPDVPVDTPYHQPGEPTWRSYVAETAFNLSPDPGEQPTLFMHPPSLATYTLTMPPQAAVLDFGMGMDPQSYDWPGDGVTFEVWVNGERVFLEHVDKAMASQGWHERTVDLTAWAGQEVALTLGTTPGPAGNTTGDWAGWREPQVVDPQFLNLEKLEPSAGMVEAWQRTGLTVEDLIARGEQARDAGLYDEAMAWYKRTMRLEPQAGDPWYFVGLLYENQEMWPQALGAYARAIASERLLQVGRSSAYYRLASIYQRRLPSPKPRRAMAAYQGALAADDFSSAVEAAWTHARLAQLYYDFKKDAVAAETEILRALELAPEDRWIYVVLGDVYQRQRRTIEAAQLYEQALAIDPSFEAAQSRLDAIREGK